MTWEDQQNINKFGRLNNRFHELEDEIKVAKVQSVGSFICNRCWTSSFMSVLGCGSLICGLKASLLCCFVFSFNFPFLTD